MYKALPRESGQANLEKKSFKCSKFIDWVELASMPSRNVFHGRKKSLQPVPVELDLC